MKDNKENNEQQIKVGDYITVRRKIWNDKSKWSGITTNIYKVSCIEGEMLTYRCYDYYETANIHNCVKIPEEEVERYCEIKQSRSRVFDDEYGDEALILESSKKIKIGDTIRTVYRPRYRGQEDTLPKYDYTVLGVGDTLISCTRANKNQDLYIFPRETCYIIGDVSLPKDYRQPKKLKKVENLDIEPEIEDEYYDEDFEPDADLSEGEW